MFCTCYGNNCSTKKLGWSRDLQVNDIVTEDAKLLWKKTTWRACRVFDDTYSTVHIDLLAVDSLVFLWSYRTIFLASAGNSRRREAYAMLPCLPAVRPCVIRPLTRIAWHDISVLSGGISMSLGHKYPSCKWALLERFSRSKVIARPNVLSRRRLHFDGVDSRWRPRTGSRNNSASCVDRRLIPKTMRGFLLC